VLKSQYDIIFIGYPIWWGTMPMAIFTFLESYDFAGKTIVPFCTSGGGGLGCSISDITKLCPTSTLCEGIAVRASSVNRVENDITAWLRKIGMATK
jgi:flavodoxin